MTTWNTPDILPQQDGITDDLLFITEEDNYHGFAYEGRFYPYGESCPPVDGVLGWMWYPRQAPGAEVAPPSGQDSGQCDCADWGMMGHLRSCPAYEGNDKVVYHNPDNLSSPGEGWRFLVKGEPAEYEDEFWSGEGWKRTAVKPGEKKVNCVRVISFRTRRPLPVSDWLPIEQAPRDGTWVIGKYFDMSCECVWDGKQWIDRQGVVLSARNPTHFRPLHPTPEAGATRETDAAVVLCDLLTGQNRDETTYGDMVPADFARRLERERDEAREEWDKTNKLRHSLFKQRELLASDLTSARAEAEGLRRERDALKQLAADNLKGWNQMSELYQQEVTKNASHNVPKAE